MHYVSAEAAKYLKTTSGQIQDGGQRPHLKWLNRNNSAADSSILLKSGCVTGHVIKAENDWRGGRPQVAMQR